MLLWLNRPRWFRIWNPFFFCHAPFQRYRGPPSSNMRCLTYMGQFSDFQHFQFSADFLLDTRSRLNRSRWFRIWNPFFPVTHRFGDKGAPAVNFELFNLYWTAKWLKFFYFSGLIKMYRNNCNFFYDQPIIINKYEPKVVHLTRNGSTWTKF